MKYLVSLLLLVVLGVIYYRVLVCLCGFFVVKTRVSTLYKQQFLVVKYARDSLTDDIVDYCKSPIHKQPECDFYFYDKRYAAEARKGVADKYFAHFNINREKGTTELTWNSEYKK